MYNDPLFEIRLAGEGLHVVQEILRLSGVFRVRSRYQIDHVWLRVPTDVFGTDRYRHGTLDIRDVPTDDLRTLTAGMTTRFELLFNTWQFESRWKEIIDIEFQLIGGSHPLLVRFSCPCELYLLMADILERCHLLWDAQLVAYRTTSMDLWKFFRNIDARRYSWLSELERQYFGKDYDAYAPSMERTRKEQAARDRQPDAVRIAPEPPAPAPPQSEAQVDPGQAPLNERVVGAVEPAAGAETETAAHTTAPGEPATQPPLAVPAGGTRDPLPAVSFEEASPPDRPPTSRRPQRMYSATADKVAKLRQLLSEKQQGRHRSRPWTWACAEAEIDPKTARTHLAAERRAWDEIHARQQGRTVPPSPRHAPHRKDEHD